MLRPIIFENEDFLIHPFRKIDMLRHDSLAEDIFKILSNEEVLTFIPEKRLKTIEESKNFMFGVIATSEIQSIFAHFITIKAMNRTIGVINLISPDECKKKYTLNEYNWMIEYYLYKEAWGRNIMAEILPYFIQRVLLQGIEKLGAICNQQNHASIRLLEKSGFKKKFKFDPIQDYYETIQ
jgi:RimJ/RimL family protein N-acetyltransferase